MSKLTDILMIGLPLNNDNFLKTRLDIKILMLDIYMNSLHGTNTLSEMGDKFCELVKEL